MSTALDELTATRTVHFWGQEYEVTPVLVHEALGDGKQIIGFSPLNTRPNYYVVLVDSRWCLDNAKWDAAESFADHVDDVYQAIEDEYGWSRWCPDECEDGTCWDRGKECPHGNLPWPALNDGAGCSWWLI